MKRYWRVLLITPAVVVFWHWPLVAQPEYTSYEERLGAKKSLTVEFVGSSPLLLDSEKEKISTFMREVGAGSRIDKIFVVAWADQEFPGDNGKLPARDRRLAEERGRELRRYLRSTFHVGHISTFNMGEPANWFERVLDTYDARVKRVLAPKGMPPPAVADEYYRLHSKAKKAVLLVYLRE